MRDCREVDRERIGKMKAGRKKEKFGCNCWVAIALAVSLAVTILAVLPGCGGTPSISELWQKSLDAEKNITSKHYVINIYYQDTKFGSGLVETTLIDVSGKNGHVQRILFGQEFSEYILVDGKQYSKVMGSGTWTESPATIGIEETATQQIGELSNLPSLASSQENLGLETVNGVEAYHLTFELQPQNVSIAFPNIPAAELSANQGATVDVWIDKDKSYKVRYQALIKNKLIAEGIGYGNTRVIIDITDINKPINVAPPI